MKLFIRFFIFWLGLMIKIIYLFGFRSHVLSCNLAFSLEVYVFPQPCLQDLRTPWCTRLKYLHLPLAVMNFCVQPSSGHSYTSSSFSFLLLAVSMLPTAQIIKPKSHFGFMMPSPSLASSRAVWVSVVYGRVFIHTHTHIHSSVIIAPIFYNYE